MNEKSLAKFFLRLKRTVSDPIRMILIIMTIPTLYWLAHSVIQVWKVDRNFLIDQNYYSNSSEVSITEKIEEDLKRSQILYNYYSVITYLGNSAILSATLLATEIGLFFAYRWNRKKTAFDTINSMISGHFLDIRNQIEMMGVNPYNAKANYVTDRNKIKHIEIKYNNSYIFEDLIKVLIDGKENYNKNKINGLYQENKLTLVRDILNTFDLISTGIRYKIIDEDIAFEQLNAIMFAYWRWSFPYILLARMLAVRSTHKHQCFNNKIYSDFEERIYIWERREGKTEFDFINWKNQWIDSVIDDVTTLYNEISSS